VVQQTCDGCGKRHTGSDGSYLVCCCVDFLLAHLPPDTIVPRMSLANGELLATEVASDGSS
jgi:hypothetical protein